MKRTALFLFLLFPLALTSKAANPEVKFIANTPVGEAEATSEAEPGMAFQDEKVSTPSSSGTATSAFVVRLRNGQAKFRQGETITLKLGYGADPQASTSSFPMHANQPGLAVDEFRLEPRTGVTDPLRDFMGSVGAWDGPPPRATPFVEERGPWAAIEINEWFRFDKPGRYHLSVLAHAVRSPYEVFRNREPGVMAVTSNVIELEIVPADPAWQAATLKNAARVGKANPGEACRIVRFLTTRAAVDEMIQHYADEGVCGGEYRYGLFAFPDREYVVKKMEDGILEPSAAVSTDYLDTLARRSTEHRPPAGETRS